MKMHELIGQHESSKMIDASPTCEEDETRQRERSASSSSVSSHFCFFLLSVKITTIPPLFPLHNYPFGENRVASFNLKDLRIHLKQRQFFSDEESHAISSSLIMKASSSLKLGTVLHLLVLCIVTWGGGGKDWNQHVEQSQV